MSTIFTAIGAFAFAAACLVVGVRLLLLARRTRQLPELLIGFSFITGGAMSYVLSWITGSSAAGGAGAQILAVAGRVLFVSSPVAMAFVAWRVFRPTRAWAGVAVGALLTINLLYVIRPFLIGDLRPGDLVFHPLYWINTAAQILPWLWVALESFHLYRMLRRRARVGLAEDPALAYRMLLWALGLGSLVLMSVSLEAISFAAALNLPHPPRSPLIIVPGLACALAFWLAFFPPAGLVRRFESQGP